MNWIAQSCNELLDNADYSAYGIGGLKDDLIEVLRPVDAQGNPVAAMNIGMTWPDVGKLALAIAGGIAVGDRITKIKRKKK